MKGFDGKSLYDMFVQDKINEIKRVAGEAANIADKKRSSVIAKDMKRIVDKRVNEFYMDYSPEKYKRHWDMHDVFSIDDSGDEITAEFDGKKMFGGEVAYQLDYKRGWHGGPVRGGMPVCISEPPYMNIDRDREDKEDEWDNIWDSEFYSYLKSHVNLNWN